MPAALRIEQFEPRHATDEQLAAAHAVHAVVAVEEVPDEPPPTIEGFIAERCHRPAYVEQPSWVATEDGEPVGYAALDLLDVPDNRAYAEFELEVMPAARRRGVGTALLDAVRARSRAEGRPLTTTYALLDQNGPAFLEHHGFTCRQEERRSRLRIADVDRGLLRSWIERAPERAANYSLVGWVGPCPDDRLESYAALNMVMNTAPLDDVEFEDMVITPERIRAAHATHHERGLEASVLCARHDPSGDLVGYTEIFSRRFGPWRAEQNDTGVGPKHRDKGLGRWLKAANLLAFLDAHPETESVDTWNAEGNAAMLGINVAMGFEPWQAWGTFQPGAVGGA